MVSVETFKPVSYTTKGHMGKAIMRKIAILIIVLALFFVNFSNFANAKPSEINVLKENISSLMTQKKIGNGKLEQSVSNLLTRFTTFSNPNFKQLNDFDFVGDKVRLEVILKDEVMLGTLTSFSSDIEIENHYKSLAQILLPVDQILDLSKEEYVQYIRSPVKHVPTATSEGVAVISADLVQAAGYAGAGVKVAVIDDGFDGYATDPDLPSARIKEATSYRADHDIECGIDHGTACAEIVLDVAPQADLYLYNFDTISELNSAVSRAIAVGVDIISFSISYVNINNYDGVGYSGIGDVCSIVNNARSHGILFVVAAGNLAEKHYEGTYTDGNGNYWHDFDTGEELLSLGTISAGSYLSLYLSWNDWPAADQDYDLYLYDSSLNIVGWSENYQTGSQPPTEAIEGTISVTDEYYVAILKASATVNSHFELYSFDNNFATYDHPESSLTCPADATGATSVGATYWGDDSLESYSSRGPTNDARTKPDVTGPDGVTTYIKGVENFYGTSASTPHVAGTAALLLSVDSTLTPSQLQTVLETTAVDLGAAGKDNLYGSGRINAWDAYNSPTVNKPPVANNDYYTTAEDTTRTVTAPGVLTNDTDGDGDSLTATKVTNPTHGTITSFNSNGAFVYVPTANYFGTDSFTYKAWDGTVYSNIATVHITVTSVNDAPVVGDIPSQTIAEGSTFTTISLDNYVSDVDNTDAEMTWTYSGNSSLTVNIVSRVATITIPSADWYGAETITFRATDPGSLWDDDAATFTVTAENDPPIVSGIPDQTIAEGSTFATINLDNYVTDIDNTDAQMTWTYSGNSQLTVSIVARVATIGIPNADWNGAETVTFRATDPGSLWSQDAAVFTVAAVNDVPVVSDIPGQTINEGSAFTTINLDNYVSDIDNTDAQMTWTYSGNVQLTVSIVNRVATISIPNIDWHGSETITFRATDPLGLWDDDSAMFTVTSVNDMPIANFTYSPSNPSVDEEIQFTDISTDTDGTIISWNWDFGDGNTAQEQNPTHEYTQQDVYSVTLTVEDDEGAIDDITKFVSVGEIYVDDDNAAGPWDGSLEHPYQHIQEGINAADPGNTVFVFNGTYYENVEINKDGLKLIGENKITTIIDAHGTGNGTIITVPSHNMVISNFTIRNANGCGIIFRDPISATHVKYNTISDCIIYNSSVNSDYRSGNGILLEGHDAQMEGNVVINCEIYDNDASGIMLERSAYGYFDNNKIMNCKIHSNGYSGWFSSAARAGIGIVSHSTQMTNTIISDCEIYDNAGDGIFHDNYAYNFYITNNAIYGNAKYGINITGNSNSVFIYHNNLISNLENAYDSGANIWDNGYPSGGNYWDDYTGIDNNGDGIGDTPYYVPGGSNQDNYPLMYPYSVRSVAFWHFNEGAGNITSDSSGYGFDGSIQNATWTDGFSGHGLDFGGIYESGYVDFTSPVLNTPPYTICLWAKPDSITDGYYYLISNGGETASYGFYMTLNIDELSALSGWNFGVRGIDGKVGNINCSVTSTDWVFLCGTWDGSANVDSVKFYINGVLSSTGTPWLESGHPNPYNLRIGLPHHPNYYGFNGTMDEVSIYNGVLTSDDIKSLYEEYVNQQPIITTPNPTNGSTGVSISTSSLSITIQDPDGDHFNWMITTSPNIGTNSGIGATNGTKTCTITGLAYSTTYTWAVKAYDEHNYWTNKSYTFTTAATPSTPPPPSGPSGPSGPSEPFGPIGDTNLPPKADANGPYYSFTDGSITFDGSSSSDSDGSIAKYSWNFGDGTNGTGKTVTHSYNKIGNYTVTLTVTDNNGSTSSDKTYAVITEKPNYPPNADFSYSPLNPTIDDTMQFTDLSTDSDGAIVSYFWNFSDGTNSTDKNPKHKYSKSGAYTITLKITDDDNATDIFSKAILVEESNKDVTGTTTEKPKGTPGFEIILVVCAIALVLFWKRRRKL